MNVILIVTRLFDQQYSGGGLCISRLMRDSGGARCGSFDAGRGAASVLRSRAFCVYLLGPSLRTFEGRLRLPHVSALLSAAAVRRDPNGLWLSAWPLFWTVSYLFSASSLGVGGNALGFVLLDLYLNPASGARGR